MFKWLPFVTDDEKQLSAKDLKRCKRNVFFEAENGPHFSLPSTMQLLGILVPS